MIAPARTHHNAETDCDGLAEATRQAAPVIGMLTANGSRDSHAVTLAAGGPNRSPRAGKPYATASWAEIRALVETPAAVPKDRARLVVLSTYNGPDGRTHAVQRERGVFHGLAVDIDKGNPSIDDVADAVQRAVGTVKAEVYSSSSAAPDKRKWRVLIPLATPIAGADYADTQLALFELLAREGLACDPTLSRAAQPVYLPNVPPERRDADGRPVFYQYRHIDGPDMALSPGHAIMVEVQAARDRRSVAAAAAAAKAEEYKARRRAYVESTGDDFEAIRHFNEHHTVAEMLSLYGFVRKDGGHGSHWRSPLSESGSYSTEDRGTHWVTVSNWAHAKGVGRVSVSGNRYGDAFDLYAYFDHRGDRSAAVKAYADEVCPHRDRRVDGAGTAPLRVEHLADDDAEVVPLGVYRHRIAAAVSRAVRVPGVHLNTAGTGCGKTFATAKEVAKLPRSVTSAPTHALCEERAAELRSFGAAAAAYPALDATTCANFAEASRVQAAGLSPGRVLCHGCPFRTECEANGYLAGVKAADKAPHKVVTHARLARSARTVCRDVRCVVLEEEPTAAVRPSIAARGKELLAVSTFAKLVARRMRHEQRIEEVDLSAIGFTDDPDYGLPTGDDAFAEFAAWAPPTDSSAAAPDKETARDVVHGPRRRVRALQAKRLHKAAFFRHVADVAKYLHVETRAAMRRGSGVYVISMPAPVKPPKNIDGIVWPMMAEAADPIPPESLRLAVAAASGGLQSLVVQVDANERYAKSHPDAKPLLRARVIGLWQTALPYRTAAVIVNDGTNDAATVQAIVGREVNDITPAGRVPLQHPCVQYAVDVTLGTRPQTVANIMCGIARANPDKSRLGTILLKAHRDKLLPVADAEPATGKRKRSHRRGPLLPRTIRRRVEWHTHYGSGLDRGSNDMHERVDLAIVVGTFRPPPHEVRRRLVEMGLIEEAHKGDQWGVIKRHARRPDGTEITYTGLGYLSEAWRRAAESLCRAAVRQAIGRARANTSRGVPVVAVTTEATGLPVLPAADLPRSKPEIERVAEAVRMAGATEAKSAITTTSRNGLSCSEAGVTLDAVQARLPRVPRRTVRRWLTTAVEAGVLIREGRTTAVRYKLAPAPAAPPRVEVCEPGERCPSCGSGEHCDTVSADGQVGRLVCAECGAFVRFTVWHGKPVLSVGVPPPLSARVLDVAATVSS